MDRGHQGRWFGKERRGSIENDREAEAQCRDHGHRDASYGRLTALQHIMSEHPMPGDHYQLRRQETSGHHPESAGNGAVDFIPKTSGSLSLDIEKVAKIYHSKR